MDELMLEFFYWFLREVAEQGPDNCCNTIFATMESSMLFRCFGALLEQ